MNLTNPDLSLHDKLALANAKRLAMREAGIPLERLDPLQRAERNPKSLRLALNGKCWDCQGGGADGIKHTKDSIRLCQARDCSLWNLRPYQTTAH